MAAITPSTVLRKSMGSDTLLVATLTCQSSSDTWTTEAGFPATAYWAQSNAGSGLQEPDVTFAQSTGIFTFTSGTITAGQFLLFVLCST